MIRVLVVEDQTLVRQGIGLVLDGLKGIKMVGEASSGKEGLALAREKEPNLVVLDFNLPDSNGLEITRKLLQRLPDLKILIVTAMKSDILPMKLLEVGAHGFITKDSGGEELEHAIRAVNSGQRYLSPDIANRLALSKAIGNKETPFDDLSKREMEVLLLLAKGMTVQAISEQLFLSQKTVNSYRYRMFDKLGVKNDVSLIMLAIQYGLIEISAI